jgi:CBS domain-containing protein
MGAVQSSPNVEWDRICVDRDATVLTASRLMGRFSVDELVVTDRAANALVPIGIVCARDIVVRILAVELDPAVLRVGDITWLEPAQAVANDSLHSRLRMGNKVLPVIDREGTLTGVVLFDELLRALVRFAPN